MAEKTAVREFSPDSNPDVSEAGFYSFAEPGRLNRDSFERLMNCGLSPGVCASLFTGVLMPHYLHNNNNLMVGVMGNLDLAGMFMPDLARVEPKLKAARTATSSAVDFLRQLSDAQGYLQGGSPAERMRRLGVLIEAACGRSVHVSGLDGMWDPGEKLETWLASVHGALAWALLCMGGNGRIDCSFGGQCSLVWERPRTSGSPHMPGSEMAMSVLALAAGLVTGSGGKVMLHSWSDHRGEVRIVI
jgi:hypothetical protein